MSGRVFAILMVLAAIAGLVFASLSTADFVQHLDRQVHSIHCSFVPGLAPSNDASSGCHVALMSPWSSVFRSAIWGGLPISLPGMAIFAFLLFRAIEIWAVRGLRDRAAAIFLLAATVVPVLTSMFYGAVAIVELDAFCKTCAGIYMSSLLCFVAAFGLVLTTKTTPASAGWEAALEDEEGEDEEEEEEEEEEERPAAAGRQLEPVPVLWLVGIAEGVGFVIVLAMIYVLVMPDHSRYIGTCGKLTDGPPAREITVPLGSNRTGLSAVEVFDPLCPACRGFERRLASSGLASKLNRSAVLFPLDNDCNWMIGKAIHPGACAVSEAILCAESKSEEVIDWAFEHQEEVREASTDDPGAAKKMVLAAFPELKGCVGSNRARQRLNRSLRWAVDNELPVLTPQLYVNDSKLCDEDTDLGLDYALSRLLAMEHR